MIFASKLAGPRKTETFRRKQDSCISGPIPGQNVVLARVISRNGGFRRGRNRGFSMEFLGSITTSNSDRTGSSDFASPLLNHFPEDYVRVH